jgi:hypothetical protein
MKIRFLLSMIAAFSLMLVGTAGAEVIFQTDFETDATSFFNVFGGDEGGANDFAVDFNYDFTTWVAEASQTGATEILQSPNATGPGTTAVRFEVNNQDTTAAAAAVQIFPITAGINDLAIYTLKFDFWQAYNGGVAGGGGSTEFIQVGGHALGTQAEWPSASASSGFFWTMTADGGAAQDVRYYEGAGAAAPTRDDTIPNWWDENAINMVIGDETTWQTIFPAPPYKSAGAPGHAWTTVEMQVNGPAVSVFITSASPGNRVKVASWNTTNGAGSGIPFIGYWDGFSSIENPIGDNFLLIDNLSITVPEVTSIPGREWSNYR